MAGVATSAFKAATPPLPGPAVYRPRHPERTAFYKLFQDHFERYLREYEDRFEPRHGPLRPVVRPTVEAYLECGRLHGGFARIRCPKCRAEHLLAFSCQTRNFCGSCQAKRAALFAEKLVTEILDPVPIRHIVFTIPRALRGLFERDRSLLGLLTRCAWDTLRTTFRAALGQPRAQAAAVLAVQTFGAYAANFHPHVHGLAADGLFLDDGRFLPLPPLEPRLLEEVFRRSLLTRLHRDGRLSEEFRDRLLTWSPSGFSAQAQPPLPPDDPRARERLARYILRGPLPADAVSLDRGGVLVRTPPHPRTGATAIILDPLFPRATLHWSVAMRLGHAVRVQVEAGPFIHALTTQIPDPRRHLVRYYGRWSPRTRGRRQPHTAKPPRDPTATACPPAPSRKASWARMLRRVFEIDPLLCPRCGSPMKILAVLTDPDVVFKIIRHLERGGGDDPFDPRAPPPDP